MAADRFWDEISAGGGGVTPDEARRLIVSLIPNVRGHSVLDAGCGAGEYSAAFAALGAQQVAAFDISVGSLRQARQKSGVWAARASLGALPYRAAAFDIVWAWGTLHYAPNPTAALHELGRVLKPDGVVAIHTLRTGLWAALELGSARLLSRAPRPAQRLILGVGERAVGLLARLISRPGAPRPSKSLRQKLHERLFVPTRLTTFTLEALSRGLGPTVVLTEAFPPVSDLLRRNMSITAVGRKSEGETAFAAQRVDSHSQA